MADRKYIKNGLIKAIVGKPLQLPKKDDDGEILLTTIDECDECGRPTREEPILVDATVGQVIEMIIFNIPNSIASKNDPARVPQMYNAVERAGDEDISLRAPLYKWFTRLLSREVPIAAEFSKQGVKPLAYGVKLFNIANAGYIAWQLEAEDDRVDDFFDRDDDTED